MTDTEIILAGGVRVCVACAAERAETAIVSAARGSILELAWLTEAGTGRRVGINPDHVLMIRALDDERDGDGRATQVADTTSGGDRAGQDLNEAPVTPVR